MVSLSLEPLHQDGGLGGSLTPTAPGSSRLPSPPSPFVACGLSSPPRPPGSVSAGGGEVRRGEASHGGWGRLVV